MLDRPDVFLDRLKQIHAARAAIALMSDKERIALARARPGRFTAAWEYQARGEQLPPPFADWWLWALICGRGFGKTRSLSGLAHIAAGAGVRRIVMIGPTVSDLRDVNVEGPSGILATCGRDARPLWIKSERKLVWPNGTICLCLSADEPDTIRGKECELVLIDELGRMSQQEIFDQAMAIMRGGHHPRMAIATTPRRSVFMKTLIARQGIALATGTTFDNEKHLPAEFVRRLKQQYEGTQWFREELLGMLVFEPPDALFRSEWIRQDDVAAELIETISIGVDPSGGGDDETGIVAAALLNDRRYAVLADRSLKGTPSQWGEAAVRLYDEMNADDIVAEVNYGGDMVVETVKRAAERLHAAGERAEAHVRIKKVTASRGKVLRAEPISALHEQGRVLHRRGLDRLHAEMVGFSRDWDRAKDGSPGRLDAMVWALTRLTLIREIVFA